MWVVYGSAGAETAVDLIASCPSVRLSGADFVDACKRSICVVNMWCDMWLGLRQSGCCVTDTDPYSLVQALHPHYNNRLTLPPLQQKQYIYSVMANWGSLEYDAVGDNMISNQSKLTWHFRWPAFCYFRSDRLYHQFSGFCPYNPNDVTPISCFQPLFRVSTWVEFNAPIDSIYRSWNVCTTFLFLFLFLFFRYWKKKLISLVVVVVIAVVIAIVDSIFLSLYNNRKSIDVV